MRWLPVSGKPKKTAVTVQRGMNDDGDYKTDRQREL